MAGSYDHIMDGWSLIENMGDAYEAVEELMWLVQSQIGTEKARELLAKEFYPMKRKAKSKDAALRFVEEQMSK